MLGLILGISPSFVIWFGRNTTYCGQSGYSGLLIANRWEENEMVG